MKIKTITDQHRRDFTAVFECEHCGYTEEGGGYDDEFFHGTVIPDMVCKKCEKKAAETFRPLAPKYAADEVV